MKVLSGVRKEVVRDGEANVESDVRGSDGEDDEEGDHGLRERG